jgi:urease accessory protein UreF
MTSPKRRKTQKERREPSAAGTVGGDADEPNPSDAARDVCPTPRALLREDDDDARGFADWATWQLIDPLLPTGGFAHSQGLEAAARAGLVAGGDERSGRRGEEETGWDVGTFARECVANAASQSVPFVEAARRVFERLAIETTETKGLLSKGSTDTTHDDDACLDEKPNDAREERRIREAVEDFVALDRRLAARLVGNAAATRASSATGAALLRAAIAAFGNPNANESLSFSTREEKSSFLSEPLTEALRRAKASARSERARATRLPGAHVAVVFGAVSGALGFGARHAARMFVYLTLRDTLSAATRLNLLGPLAAGAAMRRCAARADARAAEAADACARAADLAAADRFREFDRDDAPRRKRRAALLAMTSRAASSAPLVDVVHAGHDALLSRLFNT